jgi:hypothetical protein
LGPTNSFKDLKIYDFAGNLLEYEVEHRSALNATYFIHFPKPIEPGEKIRYITVSSSIERMIWLSEGPIWSLVATPGSSSKAELLLYKLILPKSAILLKTYPEVLLTDKVEDRIALTFRISTRNVTRIARLAVSFLWPDKDGATMDDVPLEMRGLRDPKQDRIIREANKQIARIADGQRFADLSTPMNALLTCISDIVHDPNTTAETIFANPRVKRAFNDQLNQVRKLLIQARKDLSNLELHSCSLPPAEPKQGDKAWIKGKYKATFKPIGTVECIYTGRGQWEFSLSDYITPPPSE